MTYHGIWRVSVAVHDLETAIDRYERLGFKRRSEIKESLRGLGLRWIELGNDTRTFLELMSSTTETSALGRFLQRHGEGVYQVRLGTDAVDAALDLVEEQGARVVRDDYRGPGSRKLGWLHPSSTHGVLFELVEGEPS